MLQRNLHYIAILLIAGVIYGCGATNPQIESAKIQIKNQAYQEALEASNEAIRQDSTNALGYFYKGIALSELAAQQQSVEEQHEYYEQMKEAFNQADSYFAQQDNPPKESRRIDLILSTTWAQQHNRGVKYLTVDSLQNQEGIRKAIGHFKNASTVQPDSVMTYDAMTQAYLLLEPRDLEGAIKSLETSIKKQQKAESQQYKQLAQIYVLNDNLEQAATTLEEARKIYPDSLALVRQLTDTYFRLDQRDKALKMVRTLIDKEPDNPRYHKVLGTQIYQAAQPLNDSLRQNFDRIFQLQTQLSQSDNEQKREQSQQQIKKIENRNKVLQDSLTNLRDRALEELKKVVELNPKDHESFETIGIIYQNMAAIYDNRRNITVDNELANKYDKMAREELKTALEYYNKAVELAPDNKGYWQHLFQVYSRLGMEEKAREAGKKAGIELD